MYIGSQVRITCFQKAMEKCVSYWAERAQNLAEIDESW
jgi:hypothetical protein